MNRYYLGCIIMNDKWCLMRRLHYLRAAISRALGPVLVIVLAIAMVQIIVGLDTSVAAPLAIFTAILLVLNGVPLPTRRQGGA